MIRGIRIMPTPPFHIFIYRDFIHRAEPVFLIKYDGSIIKITPEWVLMNSTNPAASR